LATTIEYQAYRVITHTESTGEEGDSWSVIDVSGRCLSGATHLTAMGSSVWLGLPDLPRQHNGNSCQKKIVHSNTSGLRNATRNAAMPAVATHS
jgi:hypothetical protein